MGALGRRGAPGRPWGFSPAQPEVGPGTPRLPPVPSPHSAITAEDGIFLGWAESDGSGDSELGEGGDPCQLGWGWVGTGGGDRSHFPYVCTPGEASGAVAEGDPEAACTHPPAGMRGCAFCKAERLQRGHQRQPGSRSGFPPACPGFSCSLAVQLLA